MSNHGPVLIVESGEAAAQSIVNELQRAGFDPEWKRVAAEPEFLHSVHPLPDLILSDYSIDSFGALQERLLDIPVIIVSDPIGEEAEVESLRRGASGFLLKGRLDGLGLTLGRAMEEKRLRDIKRNAEVGPSWTFDHMLALLLKITDSAFGFIGEVMRKPDGRPYLKMHAVSNIAWNEETRRLYETHAASGSAKWRDSMVR